MFFYNSGLNHKKKFHHQLKILQEKFHNNFFKVNDKLQNRCCLNCGAENWNFEFTNPANFEFLKCTNCYMVMINPTPSEIMLNKLYNSPEMKINLSGANINKGVIAQGGPDLDYITSYINNGRLLDIGTGVGGFLLNASKKFEAEGLEINKNHADIGSKYGLKIHNVYSSDFKPSKKYDIVTMLQVIEHLFNPINVIKDARGFIKNGGYLYVACPNYVSKSMKIFKEKHNHVSSFGHINMYSPNTLTSQIEQCGFKLIGIETYDTDIELHDLFYYYFRNKKFRHRMANYNPFVWQLSKSLSFAFKAVYDSKLKKDEGSYIRAIFKK